MECIDMGYDEDCVACSWQEMKFSTCYQNAYKNGTDPLFQPDSKYNASHETRIQFFHEQYAVYKDCYENYDSLHYPKGRAKIDMQEIACHRDAYINRDNEEYVCKNNHSLIED